MRVMKIYLMGYMGSGKTTVGGMLAEQMKLEFVDFDRYVEKESGKTIAEIFDTLGEVKFREMEHECLKKLLPKSDVVISLGGGTPCFHNNIELINKNGISIFLDEDVRSLTKRLAPAKDNRPLIGNLNEKELELFIETNLAKRLPIYNQAHISVNTRDQTADSVVKEVRKKISELS